MLKRILPVVFIYFSLHSYGQEVETINRYRQGKLADEFYEKGLICFENDRYTEAIESLTKSTSLDPGNFLAYYFLGASYERIPEPEKALLNYNLSLTLKPDFSEALFGRAHLQMESGNYEQAVRDFLRLLEIPPGETQAIYFRGIGFGEKDENPGFDELVTMSGREKEIHGSLGQCYLKMNRYDSAIFHFTEAIRLEPESDYLYVNRGLAWLQWGENDSARVDFQSALALNPDNSLAGYNLTLLNPENSFESIEQINRIIRNNPGLSDAYASRAYFYFRQEEYELAKQDYDSAISLDGDDASYYLYRGMCHEKMNDFEASRHDFIMAGTLDPGDPSIWYNLGNLYYKLENYTEAISAYNTAIGIDPGKGPAYYNRGLTFFQMGDLQNACEDMNRAFTLKVEPAGDFLDKKCNSVDRNPVK